MNATATAADPEPSAPAFDPATAERTVLDRAEFARLIRKHRSVYVTVFASSYEEVVRGCASRCFGVDVSAKQALDRLNSCAFDAFLWEYDRHGPSVSFAVAPAWMQRKRRRDFVAARIPQDEARLARPVRGDRLDEHMRGMAQRQLISDRAEVAHLDCELASRHATPAAA